MKKTLKKILNLAMAIVILVSSFATFSVISSAASYTTFSKVTEAEVIQRLDNIINNVYRPNTCYGRSFDGGNTCYGFGKEVVYRIFGAYNSGRYRSFYYSGYSTSGMNTVDFCTNFSYSNVQNLLSNAKIGDVLQFNSPKQHTMIIKSINDGSVTVYHSNWDNKDTVRLDTFSFGYFSGRNSSKLSLLRSDNYEISDSNFKRINLYETATVTANSGLTIRKSPDINSAKVGTLAKNTTVNVSNYPITDSSGYTWRNLLNGQGWVCSNYLKITGGNCIISGTYRIQCANGKFLSYCSIPQNDVNVVSYEDLSGTEIEQIQLWQITPLFYYSDSGAVVYRISPILNTKYSLDCDVNNRRALHLWQNYDIGAQQWIFEVYADGGIKLINNATRYALEIENGNNNNNAEIVTNSVANSSRQKFYIVEP